MREALPLLTADETPGPTAPGLAPPAHDAVAHPARARILRELDQLYQGGLRAELRACPDGGDVSAVVLYHAVPVTSGPGEPAGDAREATGPTEDVVVPVPSGYPAGEIDLAGLTHGAPRFPRLKGGNNPQRTITVDGRQWTLASYHPHQNGGGRPWNPMADGFHTYVDHLIAWLACQS